MADFALREVAAVPEPWQPELPPAGPVLVAVGPAAFVAALGALSDGYFANSWSWAVLVCLWISAVVVAVGSPARIDRGDLTALITIAASAQPWRLLGEAQLAGSAAAKRSFRKAIAKDPGDWNLYFDLARATTARVQFAALAAASRLNPRSPEIAEFRRELAAQTATTVGGGS